MNRLIALFGAVVVALSLFAQTHSESITVEVVDVPVYVYNSSGPVQNLTKDDFELFVNGNPQRIDYFDPIDFTAPGAKTAEGTAPPRDIRDRRLFLLMFDCAFTRPEALDRARRAAVAMIDAAGPADYFSIATFTSKNGAQLIVPFTNDHDVAKRAAMTLQASSIHDPLAITISANERELAELIAILNDDSPGHRGGGGAAVDVPPASADAAAMPKIRLIEDQVSDFTALANRLASFEGYKHVVVMSEGFSPGTAYHESAIMDDLKAMSLAFRRAGAFVDAIDIGGTFRDSFQNDVLHLIARETGGQFIERENDLRNALNRISSASAVGYRLGFNMPSNAKKGDNSIELKVRHAPAGTTLSYRRGFSTIASKPSASDGLRLADVILNDVPQDGIAPQIRFAEKPYVEIWLPARLLLAANNNAAVNADVFFYVFDAKKGVVTFKEKRIVIPADAKQEIALRDALKLPSGAYVAKALLRVGDSIGFTKQAFAIP